MVVTVAWEISWYQYRVSPDGRSQYGSSSAATTWRSSTRAQEWNAQLADDGRLMPDIARV